MHAVDYRQDRQQDSPTLDLSLSLLAARGHLQEVNYWQPLDEACYRQQGRPVGPRAHWP